MPSTDTVLHKVQFDLLGLACIFAGAGYQLGSTQVNLSTSKFQ